MLSSIRQWLGALARSRRIRRAMPVFDAWAQARGFDVRKARGKRSGAGGCIVEGRQGRQAWRAEWGAPQRHYLPGFELRFFAEPKVPRDLTVMLIGRALKDQLEKEIYQRYIDDLKTRSDADMPAELRWLTLLPSMEEVLPSSLRANYCLVGSDAGWVKAWLQNGLLRHLSQQGKASDVPSPWVVTIARGRVALRCALAEPTEERIAAAHTLFEHALREAMRLAQDAVPANGATDGSHATGHPPLATSAAGLDVLEAPTADTERPQRASLAFEERADEAAEVIVMDDAEGDRLNFTVTQVGDFLDPPADAGRGRAAAVH